MTEKMAPYSAGTNEPERMNYLIRGIDKMWWRRVRSAAALRGVTVREMIIAAVERYIE